MLTVPRRLARIRTDPWDDYWDCAQSISALSFAAVARVSLTLTVDAWSKMLRQRVTPQEDPSLVRRGHWCGQQSELGVGCCSPGGPAADDFRRNVRRRTRS